MQFTAALFTAVVGFFATPGALAAPSPAGEIVEARAADAAQYSGHVFVCTNSGFTGDCSNLGFNVGQCLTFPSEFQDDISSIGPDSGFECYVYVDYYCKTDQAAFSIVNPGISDLSTGPYNDALSSILCNRA